MKFPIVLSLATLLIVSQVQAAEIVASDENGQRVSIALDKKGTPRVNRVSKSYPTIKDFREETDFSDACFEGETGEVKELIEALVNAANGDGDSWANLKFLKATPKKITAVVSISDESGEDDESFSFTPCGK